MPWLCITLATLAPTNQVPGKLERTPAGLTFGSRVGSSETTVVKLLGGDWLGGGVPLTINSPPMVWRVTAVREHNWKFYILVHFIFINMSKKINKKSGLLL